ncbi:MAG: hypothetical protein ACRCZO_15590 [Cetobacterium sp.]
MEWIFGEFLKSSNRRGIIKTRVLKLEINISMKEIRDLKASLIEAL